MHSAVWKKTKSKRSHSDQDAAFIEAGFLKCCLQRGGPSGKYYFPFLCTHCIIQPAKAFACQMLRGIFWSTIYLRVTVSLCDKEQAWMQLPEKISEHEKVLIFTWSWFPPQISTKNFWIMKSRNLGGKCLRIQSKLWLIGRESGTSAWLFLQPQGNLATQDLNADRGGKGSRESSGVV